MSLRPHCSGSAPDPRQGEGNRAQLKSLDQLDRVHSVEDGVTRDVVGVDDDHFVGGGHDRLDEVIAEWSFPLPPSEEHRASTGVQLTARRDREPRQPIDAVTVRPGASQEERVPSPVAAGMLEGHRREQVVEAGLVAVRAEKRHQPIDRREREKELTPDRDPTCIGLEPLHAKPGLAGRNRFEEALSHGAGA